LGRVSVEQLESLSPVVGAGAGDDPNDAHRFEPAIVRWLRGHVVGNRTYDRLWRPEVDIGDGHVYLGFRDLMEVRVADAFSRKHLSPQKVRRAIEIASKLMGQERSLSTQRFRTDGPSSCRWLGRMAPKIFSTSSSGNTPFGKLSNQASPISSLTMREFPPGGGLWERKPRSSSIRRERSVSQSKPQAAFRQPYWRRRPKQRAHPNPPLKSGLFRLSLFVEPWRFKVPSKTVWRRERLLR